MGMPATMRVNSLGPNPAGCAGALGAAPGAAGADGRPAMRLVNSPGAALAGDPDTGGGPLSGDGPPAAGGFVGSPGESAAARSSCVKPPGAFAPPPPPPPAPARGGWAGCRWRGGSGAGGSASGGGTLAAPLSDAAARPSWGPNNRVNSPGALGGGGLAAGRSDRPISSAGPPCFQRISGFPAGGGDSAGGLSRQRTTTLGRSGWDGVGGELGAGGGSEGTAVGALAPGPKSCVKSPGADALFAVAGVAGGTLGGADSPRLAAGAGDSRPPPCRSGSAPKSPVNSPAPGGGVSGADD